MSEQATKLEATHPAAAMAASLQEQQQPMGSCRAWQEPPALQPLLATAEAGSSEDHATSAGNINAQTVDGERGADQLGDLEGCKTPTHLADGAQPGPLKHQVFISHTGQHTAGCTFAAAILKPALEAAGLSVFIDFASLEPGCKWPKELVHAAANSAVVVVVLTKEYTQRYWCMLELSLALHSRSLAARTQQGQQQQQPLIIPVFYDEVGEVVQSDNILNYWQGEGLKQVPAHRQHWVDSRLWAANIRDMVKLQAIRRHTLADSKDRDLQLAQCVVTTAVKAIPVQLYLNEARVYGFEQQVTELASRLAVSTSDYLGLWLHGMGGSGKTTLAKLLFNRLAPHFQHSAFIELQPDERVGTQQLSSLLEGLGAANAAGLLTRLQSYVRDKAVLIMVDNVWRKGQLDDLLPSEFGQGSRVIVTSRSSQLPDSNWWSQVNSQLLQHQVTGLSPEVSMQLLRTSANIDPNFQMPSELSEVEQKLIRLCSGLPLALRLTGALLHCNHHNKPRPLNEWKGALQALEHGSNAADSEGKLKGILKTTFEALDPVQQHMLLDVATVLHGKPKRLALTVWAAWHGPHSSLMFEGLERFHLLSVSKSDWLQEQDQTLQMHDVLVALTRSLIINDGPEGLRGSRVWVQDGKLQGYRKGAVVLAAQLNYMPQPSSPKHHRLSGRQQMQLTWSDLSETIILFIIEGGAQADTASFAKQLCQRLTSTFQKQMQLPKLLWLQSQSPVNLGTKSFGSLARLQVLDLSKCWQLTALPNSVGQLTALQHLNLSFCPKLCTLPASIGQLTALQQLNLGFCPQLCTLPESIGQLTALQQLNLHFCLQLCTLPESIGQLTALQQLNLSLCEQLCTLPESIGQLTVLQQLNLSLCQQLCTLPESIGQLTVLQQLDLSGCYQLSTLPESIGQLTALQQLNLKSCKQLSTLPESIGQLTALQQLDLSHCYQLCTLPESIGQLTALILTAGLPDFL